MSHDRHLIILPWQCYCESSLILIGKGKQEKRLKWATVPCNCYTFNLRCIFSPCRPVLGLAPRPRFSLATSSTAAAAQWGIMSIFGALQNLFGTQKSWFFEIWWIFSNIAFKTREIFLMRQKVAILPTVHRRTAVIISSWIGFRQGTHRVLLRQKVSAQNGFDDLKLQSKLPKRRESPTFYN